MTYRLPTPANPGAPQAPGRTPRERCPGAEDPPREASEAPASEANNLSGWEELVSAALMGTERKAVPTIPGITLSQADSGPAQGDPAHSAAALLDQAAVLVVARRAGQLPGRGDPVAPAAPDSSPEVSMAAGERLARILAGEHTEVLPEWLEAAAVRGKHAPGHLLPGLLDRARGDRGLRGPVAAAGGARASWLAGLNPAWSFLATEPAGAAKTEPAPSQAHPVWQYGSPGERRGYLTALRASDPAAATGLVSSAWDAASTDEKAVYLVVLADRPTGADEPLLERALDDRRLEVRQQAADLLSRVPGSALGERMASRAAACLRVERGVRGARLAADPPSECDAAMRRDGITPRPPSGRDRTGERAWWLAELLAHTPLRTWAERFGLRPAELVALRMDEWGPQVIAGWARAAVTQQDREWARALLERGLAGKLPGAGAVQEMAPLPPGFPAGQLIAVLPPAEQETATTTLARSAAHGDVLLALLSGVPGPWGERLAAAILDAAAREETAERNTGWHSRAAAGLYRLAARRLDPALGAPGGLLARLTGADGDTPPALFELALTLRFRYDMLKELDQ
jgi:Family of unknown function (DUF5691)